MDLEELRDKLDHYTREVHMEYGQPVVFSSPDMHEHIDNMFALPFGTHRDADTLTRSNWRVIKEDLQGRFPDAIESHVFGHWAHGWVERLYVHRDAEDAIRAAGEWIDSLEGCPIADESDLSELEHIEITESWGTYLSSDLPGEIEDRTDEWVRQAWDDLSPDVQSDMFWNTVDSLDIYPEHDGLDVHWDPHMDHIVTEIANRVRPTWSQRCMMRERNTQSHEAIQARWRHRARMRKGA